MTGTPHQCYLGDQTKEIQIGGKTQSKGLLVEGRGLH